MSDMSNEKERMTRHERKTESKALETAIRNGIA